MRCPGLVVVIASLGLVGCGKGGAPSDDGRPDEADRAPFQGSWRIVDAKFPEGLRDADGYLMKDLVGEYGKLVFRIDDNQITVKPPPDSPEGNAVLGSALVSTDAGKSPKEFDLVPCDEKGKPLPGGNKVPGIYKFEGDTLVVAVGPVRPAAFEPLLVMKDRKSGESGVVVLHLKKR